MKTGLHDFCGRCRGRAMPMGGEKQGAKGGAGAGAVGFYDSFVGRTAQGCWVCFVS